MPENGPGRLVDACLVVRDVFDTILNQRIVVSAPIKLVETIAPAVASRVLSGDGYKINLRARVWQAQQIRGMLLRYDDHADIVYSLDQTVCWRRFVICKELAHLLVDSDAKHFTKDPLGLVQSLITLTPSDELNSETFATAAAIELLIPWSLRGQFDKMVSAGVTDGQIAEYFKVPKAIVGVVRTTYGATSAKANGIPKVGPKARPPEVSSCQQH